MELFAAADFLKEIEDGLQNIKFSDIGHIVKMALQNVEYKQFLGKPHTLLMHTAIHWPGAMETALCPMVVKLHNISS